MDGRNTERKSKESSLVRIYLISNSVNNMKYVGQSRNPKKRWLDHLSSVRRSKPSLRIHYAMIEHGVENFTFSVIEQCDQRFADDREQHWIRNHDSQENGYNISVGGSNGNNSKPKEVREKISKSKSGVKHGPCSKEKAERIRQAKLASGYTHSNETREKISLNRRVTHLTDEWKRNISKGLRSSVKYKLNEDNVRRICELNSEGLTVSKLSVKFHVSRKTIGRVLRGLYFAKRNGD